VETCEGCEICGFHSNEDSSYGVLGPEKFLDEI